MLIFLSSYNNSNNASDNSDAQMPCRVFSRIIHSSFSKFLNTVYQLAEIWIDI